MNNDVKAVANGMPQENQEIHNDLTRYRPGDTVQDSVYDHLPSPYNELPNYTNNKRERDILLYSLLAAQGSLTPALGFNYRKKTTTANLFVMIIAHPGNGKGVTKYAAAILRGVEENSMKPLFTANVERQKQQKRQLLLAGDSSGAALKKVLLANDGIGCIIESEIDTLQQAIGQDWGGFSDILRCSSENEPVKFSRANDAQVHTIDNPRLSMALAGTPNQLGGLIKGVEDGLFSRFLFYVMTENEAWSDWTPYAEDDSKTYDMLEEQLKEVGVEIDEKFGQKKIQISFSKWAWIHQNKVFGKLGHLAKETYPQILPSVKRGAAHVLRIAALLTVLRKREVKDLKEEHGLFMEVADVDVKIAVNLVLLSVQNARQIFLDRSKKKATRFVDSFYEKLPAEFSTQDAMGVGEKLGKKERTVTDNLKKLVDLKLLRQPKKGHYLKS